MKTRCDQCGRHVPAHADGFEYILTVVQTGGRGRCTRRMVMRVCGRCSAQRSELAVIRHDRSRGGDNTVELAKRGVSRPPARRMKDA